MAPRYLRLVACLALVECSPQGNRAKDELFAHRWAPTREACATDYLLFTADALEVHNAGGVSALQVFAYTTAANYPNAVMVVVGPHEPGSSLPVTENEKIGFVLGVSNGHMKLVGGGSPTHLDRATADNPNVQRFDRIACS